MTAKYKTYMMYVMELFNGKLPSGCCKAYAIKAAAITSMIIPIILVFVMIFLISHGCVDAFQLFLFDDCFFKALIKAIAKTAGTIANPALFCPCEIIT
jgi:hypothetical protein